MSGSGQDVGEAAAELTSALVAIDSINPGLVAGAAGESEIVNNLDARLARAGFTTHVVQPRDRVGRPSLVAVGSGRGNVPTVVLNEHLDTMGVSGMAAPFEPRVDGDRLSARGAADMKGGIAAIVTAAEALVALEAPCRLVLELVADEEDANIGSEAVIAAMPALGLRPDVCLIAEPTDLALARSLRGFAVVRVRFTGRASHSSQPELGVNAVTSLGRFLHAVDEAAPKVRADGRDLMVTLARGGDSAIVIPDGAECLVERRTTHGASAANPLDEVEALLTPDMHAETELVAGRDAWRLDTEGAAADLAARLGAALGTGPTFDAPYWMEAALWQDVCPTVICGPSGGGLHAVDEWVDLRQVRALARALVDMLPAWAEGHRAD
jgi:acetylornithine deacetylase